MDERLKLKIVSDGTVEGTIVLDDLGRVLENVIDFSYGLTAEGVPVIRLALVGVEVEINYKPELTSMEELDKREFPTTTVVFKTADKPTE